MSRRLRVEEQRMKQIKGEEKQEEDKFTIQMQRINSPLVWYKTLSGFTIQDLKEKHFKEVVDIFKEYYICNDVLCKNTELYNDEVSVKSYVERLMFYLRDGHSIIAVDDNYKEEEKEEEELTEAEKKKKKNQKNVEEKIKIAGVLVMRVIHRNDYARVFSRVQLVEGEAMRKCMAFKSYINKKVDVFAQLNCDHVLRYYDVCILPEYRKKGLGMLMMKCGLSVARTMDVSVIMGLFSNYRLQKFAKGIGMEILYEKYYVEWRDSEGEMIFDDPGAGNYTLALMAGYVSAIPPLEQPKPKQEEEEVMKIPPKTTRAEKRALLAKMKK